MNISRYTNIDKFVNIQYIFILLFQLAQMWKLLAPGVGLVDFLTPVGTGNTRHFRKSIVNDESDER
jgi:hypothetical protein